MAGCLPGCRAGLPLLDIVLWCSLTEQGPASPTERGRTEEGPAQLLPRMTRRSRRTGGAGEERVQGPAWRDGCGTLASGLGGGRAAEGSLHQGWLCFTHLAICVAGQSGSGGSLAPCQPDVLLRGPPIGERDMHRVGTAHSKACRVPSTWRPS